jgi:hypothetical protein
LAARLSDLLVGPSSAASNSSMPSSSSSSFDSTSRERGVGFISYRQEFFLFTFFFPLFCKNIWSEIFLQNYTSRGVRDLQPCPTVVGGARYCSTFLQPWGTAVGVQSLFKKL